MFDTWNLWQKPVEAPNKTQQDPTGNSQIAAPSPTRTKIKVQDWVQEHQAS